MKLGILGGSFNPPHCMHKQVAVSLIDNNYLDEVIFVPTGDLYPKKDLIPVKERYHMLQLMVEGSPKLSVSDFEMQPRLVYTYQTLDYFQKENPKDEIYFICGTDDLNDMITWRKYSYILENYKIMVVPRNNDNIKQILSNYLEYKDNIIVTDIKLGNLSSTIIRNCIKEDKDKDLEKMLDRKVIKYIKDNKLYD